MSSSALFDQLKDKVEARYMELARQEAQKDVQEERILIADSIRNVMTSMNMTMEEVMDMMMIPSEKRGVYRGLINGTAAK